MSLAAEPWSDILRTACLFFFLDRFPHLLASVDYAGLQVPISTALMKFTTTLAVAFAGTAAWLSEKELDSSTYRAIGRLPLHLRQPATNVPISPFPPDTAAAESVSIKERRSDWQWTKPEIIGVYPDGRLKCKAVTMTAQVNPVPSCRETEKLTNTRRGHAEGPCPPELSDNALTDLLQQEWCRSNCCDAKGKPCEESSENSSAFI